jgi:xanthine dehydrogenase accessory factor
MMLVDPDGQSLGLVSGGCLEADIRLNARKVLAFDEPRCILYDSTEEGTIAAELGLGCNGRVEILIQPIKTVHHDLLLLLLDRMEAGADSFLLQCFESENLDDLNQLVLLNDRAELITKATGTALPKLGSLEFDSPELKSHEVLSENHQRWSLNRHDHPIKLWVIGGGMDAQPLVSMAATLGWKVSLLDHRPAYARQADFPLVENIIRQRPESLDHDVDADAAILMTHNLELDANWLKRIQDCQSLRYIGLLGPVDRKLEVMELAGIESSPEIEEFLHGPMGFDIGGDIPESVALSTLAECHQVLFRRRR